MSVTQAVRKFHDPKVNEHLDLLKERVYQTETKWPHYRLLMNDMIGFAEELPEGATVVAMERNLMYGGFSPWAPVFQKQNYISAECSPESANDRGAYNKNMITGDERFIFIPTVHRCSAEDTRLESGIADLVLVPNLVHHVEHQDRLFAEMARLVKPGGRVYVFEPLVREMHQIPDDYIRYTPYGMMKIMREVGLDPKEPKLEGGPFSVIAYCWAQALEYMPEDERKEKADWFYGQHFQELLEMDEKYPKNLFRKHTSFPMSFSIEAIKK